MKKKILALFVTAALAGTALATLAACGGNGGGTGGLGGNGGVGGEGTSVEAGARNAYGIGAVTTAKLLAGGIAGTNAMLSATSQDGAADTAGQGAQEAAGEFDEYFRMLDCFLDEDAFRTTVSENTDEAYAFDYKMTVEGELLDGTAVSHTMYYSEESVGTVSDDDDDHDDDDHDDDDRDENEHTEAYRLTGVMVLDGVSYDMRGYRSVETEAEHNETEQSEELWIRATDPQNARNYVQMDLETETEEEDGSAEQEREYVYSVYADGKLTERTNVDFETENEDGAAETEYTLGILRDGVRSYYEVERAERESGSVTIGVRYRLGSGESGRFIVTQTADGEYVYRTDDGTRIDFDD